MNNWILILTGFIYGNLNYQLCVFAVRVYRRIRFNIEQRRVRQHKKLRIGVWGTVLKGMPK